MPPASAVPSVRGIPPADRCLVMGILNVTPDSFSDGGRFAGADRAIERGHAMAAEGADLVDVGGESTRPGAQRVDESEERRRVVPVVTALAAAGLRVSVDTMRASVARSAVEAGASMVNDVSGGQADPAMAPLVADAGVPFVLMHWRGHSVDMTQLASYRDVVPDVRDELRRQLDQVLAAGVQPDQVALDPGIGFAKYAEHDLALLGRLEELAVLGRPLVVGASRKRFLGGLLAADDGTLRPSDERGVATVAVTARAAAAGAWAVRVHDVAANADTVRVAAAIAGHRAASQPAGARDRIVLRGLRVHGHHGVFEAERTTGQPFVVDVALTVDTGSAARSDALALTVDYGDLADRLVAVVAGEQVDLLETVAGRLADECLAARGVAAVEVTVHKPEAPIGHPFDDVAVSVVRERG